MRKKLLCKNSIIYILLKKGDYYNKSVHNILTKEIPLLIPKCWKKTRDIFGD